MTQQAGPDIRKEAQKTRGYEASKFASAGENLMARGRTALLRRWFQPVALWPTAARRRIAEGFA